ncbi:MAG: hypothetical protein ACK5UE_10005 [Chitinophagales bacterium]|nr:hypothetical protein [Sphingobacteriales bacterium]
MKFKINPFIILVGICLIANIILSYLFKFERMIMLDMAFHLFKIISKENFAIQNWRFGAAITQFVPLLGTKMNLSLSSISTLYSISFSILYFLIYLILVLLKSERYILLLFLYLFTMTTHSFFWPISEIHQGSVILILYLALLDFYKFDFKSIPLILATIVFLPTIIFLYPLLIFAVVSIFIYFFFVKREKNGIVFIGTVIFICIFSKLNFFSSSYDNYSMTKAFNIENYLIFYSLKSTKMFMDHTFANYYLWLGSFLIMILVFIKKMNFRPLLFLLGYSFGIFLVINVSYPEGGEPFYLEGQYMQLNLFSSFIAISEFKRIEKSAISLFVVIIFFAFFMLRVFDISNQYTNRVDVCNGLIKSNNGKKIIIKETDKIKKDLKMTWGSSFETWLLSTIKTGKSSSIMITYNPDKYKVDLDKNHAWITEWETIDYEKLNPKYFVFKDTGRYELK